MTPYPRLAALTTLLLAVGCNSDNSMAPLPTGTGGSALLAAATPAATPQTVTIYPAIVIGGGSDTPVATITVAGPAVAFDRVVQVSASTPGLFPQLPTATTIPAGETRAIALVVPGVVTSLTTTTITVSGGGVSLTSNMTVYPLGATLPAPVLDSIIATPGTVAAGTTATVTVTLLVPAPAGGLVLGLFSQLPLTAQIQPTVTVPAGARSVSVPITTSIGFPNSTTTSRITATTGNSLVSNGINVVTGPPTGPPPLGVLSVVLSPATVVGGNAAQGTVTLTGAAPAGGALVTLVSTDITVATVPANVTVTAGTRSATFSIATKPVTSPTSSNIAAGFAGGFLTKTLHVTPPVSGPLAAPALLFPAVDQRFAARTSITFDWSDVSGATTYEIQISDRSSFSSLIVNQIVTASQFTTATLPSRQMWWRVRARSASGAAGIWSGARRFQVK